MRGPRAVSSALLTRGFLLLPASAAAACHRPALVAALGGVTLALGRRPRPRCAGCFRSSRLLLLAAFARHFSLTISASASVAVLKSLLCFVSSPSLNVILRAFLTRPTP